MNNTLVAIYDGKEYIVQAAEDDDHAYLLNYDKNVKKLKIRLNDEKLTQFYNTTFCFTLDSSVQDKTMPKVWELTPQMLDMEANCIGLIWGKDASKGPTKDNLQIVEVGYSLLDKLTQEFQYIKHNGNLCVDKNGKLHPEEVSKRYNIVDWFGKFFDLEYKKHHDNENYIYANCLKRQYSMNPAYDVDMLLAPISELCDEYRREFPKEKTKFNADYIVEYHGNDWNVVNELRYYAHLHEFVPDFYAYKFMGISAQMIQNSFEIKPLNAFSRLSNMIHGDTLNRLTDYLASGSFKTVPELRKLLRK